MTVQEADATMLDMARQDTERELQPDIVRKLALMNSETALASLLEILER